MSERSGAGHLDDRQEIIIVRRRSHAGEDAHHGGAWKIAFADFMTAMMALFLVMWLTNSSDTATREQVAQYFNPIRLSDSMPASRGIEKKDDGADKKAEKKGVSRVETNGDPNGKPLAGEKQGGEEQALFRDPYAVLADIAAHSVSTGTSRGEGVPDGSGLPGLNGGEAYRDPFDPASWQLDPNAVEGEGDIAAAPPAEFRTQVVPVEDPAPTAKGDDAAQRTGEVPVIEAAAGPVDAAPVAATAAGAAIEPVEAGTSEAAKAEQQAEAVRQQLSAELAKSGETLPANLKVSAGDGGVAISLADDMATGMFEIGSARPTAAAIKMMEKIARVISERPGRVTIRGHTDGRPFSNADYDNWRLSTARAHMAYYMLSRGGLDVSRVTAIEGLADRDPAVASDPNAAANRRIEIILREDGR